MRSCCVGLFYPTDNWPFSPGPKWPFSPGANTDGAIVGSAIIKLLEKYGKDASEYVGEYVRSMKDAMR